MNYYLYKLKFDTPVHFGASDSALSLYSSEDHFCADTLFSALCQTALSLKGDAGVAAFCGQAASGELLLSDGMPWFGSELYLPKPFIHAEVKREVPPRQRKAMKKLGWIPLSMFQSFADSVNGTAEFDAAGAKAVFGVHSEMTKAHIAAGEDTVPYQVGVFQFAPESGLWFIAGCETEQQGEELQTLVELLGLGGIGGKVSAGYGKFHIEDVVCLNEPYDEETEWLFNALVKQNNSYLLLSTSLPKEEELESVLNGACFQLTRRAGFVQSSYLAEGQKKQTQFFLSAGSMLKKRFNSCLYQVGRGGNHLVYRFSGPILLGVTL